MRDKATPKSGYGDPPPSGRGRGAKRNEDALLVLGLAEFRKGEWAWIEIPPTDEKRATLAQCSILRWARARCLDIKTRLVAPGQALDGEGQPIDAFVLFVIWPAPPETKRSRNLRADT